MSEGSKTPEIAAKASQTGDGAITQEALKRAEAELAAARNIDPQQYEHLQGLVRYSGVQLALKRRKR